MTRVFPESVVCRVRSIDSLEDSGYENESWLEYAESCAPVRRREFISGRLAAMDCLHALGLDCAHAGGIGVGENREPLWPEGYCGSITHSREWALAVAGTTSKWGSMGIDLERPDRLSRKSWRLVLRDPEKEWIHTRVSPERAEWWATLVFSIKESFYKWQYPWSRKWLGFHDVEVHFPSFEDAGEATLRVVKTTGNERLPECEYHLRYVDAKEFILTGMWGHL